MSRSLCCCALLLLLGFGAALAHGEAFADPAELYGVWHRYGQGQPGVWEAFEFAPGNEVFLVTSLPPESEFESDLGSDPETVSGERLRAFWELRPDGLIELSSDDALLLLDVHDSLGAYLVMSLRAGARWRSADEVFSNGVFERLEGEALERWRAALEGAVEGGATEGAAEGTSEGAAERAP